MDGNDWIVLSAIIIYVGIILSVGFYYAKRSNADSESYFLGGRKLGPFVTALSAEASDMSGYLLMGVPGLAYFTGASEAVWTAVGLALGTYLNWLFVAKRLRLYSEKAGNAVTLPEFFSNRFGDQRNILMVIAAILMLIFFSVYVGSCFVTCGKLFSAIFDVSYTPMMIVGAIIVFTYTFAGGYLSVCTTDLIQGILMFFVILMIFFGSLGMAGGVENTVTFLEQFPGFLSGTEQAIPVLDADGFQTAIDGIPQFADSVPYGLITIVSTMAWGLGYFGMPQVLVRFMGIEKADQIKLSRRVAVVWVVISLFAAVAIGIIGRAVMPTEFLTGSSAENIMISLAKAMLPAFLIGVVVSGIFAATMSSSDSYLLIVSSSASRNLFKAIRKDATDKQVMLVGRLALVVVTIFGVIIALDQNSSIFQVVSYAWAGFGASFGPLVLLSLYWRRATLPGALAGMVTGGATVIIWNAIQAAYPTSVVFGIYELLPAFILGLIVNVVVSLLTKPPAEEVLEVFDHYMD